MKMKIKSFVFFILSLFIFTIAVSCSQSSKNKKEVNNSKEYIDPLDGEDFKAFLESFNKMPTFQRQRVLFPLHATVLDPIEFEMKTVEEKIDYEDWFLLDFSYDSTYRTRQMDRYEQNIRLYNDSALIEHRGIDNGIFANYLFIKKEGRWYLKSFTDVSY